MQTKGEIWLLQIIKKEQGERERDRRIGVQSERDMVERGRDGRASERARDGSTREKNTRGERWGMRDKKIQKISNSSPDWPPQKVSQLMFNTFKYLILKTVQATSVKIWQSLMVPDICMRNSSTVNNSAKSCNLDKNQSVFQTIKLVLFYFVPTTFCLMYAVYLAP